MRLFYGCVLFSAESAIEARPLSAGPLVRQRCELLAAAGIVVLY